MHTFLAHKTDRAKLEAKLRKPKKDTSIQL